MKVRLGITIMAALLVGTTYGQLAYEGYDYAVGTDLTTVPAENGWLGPWSGNNAIISNSLEYVALDTTGNHLKFTPFARARAWDTTSATDDSSEVWFSYVININPLGTDGNDPDDVRITPFGPANGVLDGDNTYITMYNYANGTGSAETLQISNMGTGLKVPFASGINNFVVGQIIFSDFGNDTFNVWVNPTIGDSLDTPTLAEFGDFKLATEEDQFALRGQSGALSELDEIRIGTDASSVMPLGTTVTPIEPATPSNLLTTNETPISIELVWDANLEADLSGYRIFSGDSASTATNLITFASANQTNYTDNALTPETTYYYAIQAFDVFGQYSSTSTAVSATTLVLPAVPTQPTGLVATGAELKVELVWNENTEPNLASYTVLRGDSMGTATNKIGTATTTNYVDGAVTAGLTYYYAVRANDAFEQQSISSDVASAIPEELTSDLIVGDSMVGYTGSILGKNGGYEAWNGVNPYEKLNALSTSVTSPDNLAYSPLDSSGGSILIGNNSFTRSWGATSYTDDGSVIWVAFTVTQSGTDKGNPLGLFSSRDTNNPEGTRLLLWTGGTLTLENIGTDLSVPNAMISGATNLVVIKNSFSDTAGNDNIKVWTNPDLITFDGSQPATMDVTGNIQVTGNYFAFRQYSGQTARMDEIRIGKTYEAVLPFEKLTDPILSITGSGSDVIVSSTNLSVWATYKLQEKAYLPADSWSDVSTFTGVTETNITVNTAGKPNNNFQMISE